MYQVLQKDETHELRREYMGVRHGGYWFELVEIKTGMATVLTANNKEMFDGVSIDKFKQFAERMQVTPTKTYKGL